MSIATNTSRASLGASSPAPSPTETDSQGVGATRPAKLPGQSPYGPYPRVRYNPRRPWRYWNQFPVETPAIPSICDEDDDDFAPVDDGRNREAEDLVREWEQGLGV